MPLKSAEVQMSTIHITLLDASQRNELTYCLREIRSMHITELILPPRPMRSSECVMRDHRWGEAAAWHVGLHRRGFRANFHWEFGTPGQASFHGMRTFSCFGAAVAGFGSSTLGRHMFKAEDEKALFSELALLHRS